MTTDAKRSAKDAKAAPRAHYGQLGDRIELIPELPDRRHRRSNYCRAFLHRRLVSVQAPRVSSSSSTTPSRPGEANRGTPGTAAAYARALRPAPELVRGARPALRPALHGDDGVRRLHGHEPGRADGPGVARDRLGAQPGPRQASAPVGGSTRRSRGRWHHRPAARDALMVLPGYRRRAGHAVVPSPEGPLVFRSKTGRRLSQRQLHDLVVPFSARCPPTVASRSRGLRLRGLEG